MSTHIFVSTLYPNCGLIVFTLYLPILAVPIRLIFTTLRCVFECIKVPMNL